MQGTRTNIPEHILQELSEHFNTSITVCMECNLTHELASTHLRAARACMFLRNNSMSLGVNQAIQHLDKTLEIYTMSDTPLLWADAQAATAEVLCSRRQEGDIERALECVNKALLVVDNETSPAAWGGCVFCKAVCLAIREKGVREENLEQAESLCKDALKVFAADRCVRSCEALMNTLLMEYVLKVKHATLLQKEHTLYSI